MLKKITIKIILLGILFIREEEISARLPKYEQPAFQKSLDSLYSPPQNPTKTTAAALIPPLKPNIKKIIVIDPGHGGKDLGTHSKKVPRYQEKLLTLSVSRILRNYLSKLGYQVVMTRNSDLYVGLQERAEIANTQRCALFVSIHFNSAPNKQAEGVEVFYYNIPQSKERSIASKNLAETVLKRTLEMTEAHSRGVKHGNLAVIRQTQMPAILVEGGFLTHEEEEKKIRSIIYQRKLAWGIAQGIHDYLNV
jgi:N-acetylmuramoyl-L-alanine amidase